MCQHAPSSELKWEVLLMPHRFLSILAESGGMQIGRGACWNCHSGMECNWNTFTRILSTLPCPTFSRWTLGTIYFGGSPAKLLSIIHMKSRWTTWSKWTPSIRYRETPNLLFNSYLLSIIMITYHKNKNSIHEVQTQAYWDKYQHSSQLHHNSIYCQAY